jgi:hypothetical protein
MFFGITWKEGVTHWRHLDGRADRVNEFFTKLPAVAAVFAAYTTFLFEIGERSLPNAFLVVEQRLRAGEPLKILSNSSTVFCMETLLKRYVYGKPVALKGYRQLRNAALYLLDQLVDAGSSTAYRMRDDFVTPGNERVSK